MPPIAHGERLDGTLLPEDLHPRTALMREEDMAAVGDRVEYCGAHGNVVTTQGPLATVEFDLPVTVHGVSGGPVKVLKINRERLKVIGGRRMNNDVDAVEGLKEIAVQVAHRLHRRLLDQQQLRDEYTLVCRVALELGAKETELPAALTVGKKKRGSNLAYWTPERRKEQGERIRRISEAKRAAEQGEQPEE